MKNKKQPLNTLKVKQIALLKMLQAVNKNTTTPNYKKIFDHFKKELIVFLRTKHEDRAKFLAQLDEMEQLPKKSIAKQGRYGKFFYTINELKALIKKTNTEIETINNLRRFFGKVAVIVKYSKLK